MGRGLRVHDVPVRPDRVEVGIEVESLVDHVDAGPLADLHRERVVTASASVRPLNVT